MMTSLFVEIKELDGNYEKYAYSIYYFVPYLF